MKINNNFFKNIIILCLSFVFMLSFCVPVFAAENELPDGSSLDGMSKTAYDMALTVYGSSESAVMSDVESIVLYVPGSGVDNNAPQAVKTRQSVMNSIWNFARTAYQSLEAIGAGIALLYFLMEMLDKTTREMLTLEHFIVYFMKLVVILFVLNNGFVLIEKLLEINKDICDTMLTIKLDESEIKTETDIILDVYNKVSKAGVPGWWNAFSTIVQLCLPYFCVLVAKAYITFMCWSRFFEIGIRTAFSPIGMLDIVTDGFKVSNLKYIKKLFGVILQGTIIVIVMRLVGSAYTAIALGNDVSIGGFTYVIILFVEIGLIKKAQQIANDILGV